MRSNHVTHERVTLDATEDGRTKQSFLKETDVNTIMGRWRTTGHIDHLAKSPPRYGDFSSATDYLTAVNKVKAAEVAFGELPAEIRQRMDNDPGVLLDFLSDSENQEEAVALGLVDAPPEPEPAPEPTPTGGEGGPTPEPAPPPGP